MAKGFPDPKTDHRGLQTRSVGLVDQISAAIKGVGADGEGSTQVEDTFRLDRGNQVSDGH